MKLRLLPALASTFLFTLAATAAPALESGLLAHLPMKDDLEDHSRARLPVEVSGRVTLRDGAAYFEGREDWLEMPFIALNDRPFTIATWLKPTGARPTYGVLMQWDRREKNHILHLMIRNGLCPWFGFYINDVVSPLSLSNADEWQHVTFQYDGKVQQIWINGRLICQRVATAYQGTKGKTCIGRNPGWSNVPGGDYEGWMSDFRIYDRALAFAEITALVAARPEAIPVVTMQALPPAHPAGSVAPAGASDVPVLSIDAEKMQLRGKAGAEYMVEASADLVTWEELGTLLVRSAGTVDFVDEDAHRFRQRFYRLRLLPEK